MRKLPVTLRWICILCLLPLAQPAGGGLVLTTDGKTYDGAAKVEDGDTIAVTPRGQTVPVRVGFDKLLSADLTDTPAELPRWTGRDIGQLITPGFSRFNDGTLLVRSAGADMADTSDQCHFVFKTLNGDGQIIARVRSVQQTDKRAIAGVMIRSTIHEGAACALAAVQAGGGTIAQSRTRQNASTAAVPGDELRTPGWVKLVRNGDELLSFCSSDGEQWTLIARDTLSLPRQVLIGLFVCARNANAVCAANFDHISFASRGQQDPTPAGVQLRDGTILAGNVTSQADTLVRLSSAQFNLSIPLAEVSRVLFSKLEPAQLADVPPGRGGVLLKNGDFFEGEILDINAQRIKVSSIIFGIRRFQPAECVALVYRELSPAPAPFVIALADQSLLRADQIGAAGGMLNVRLAGIGDISFPAAQVQSIKSAPARFKSLLDLRPELLPLDPARPAGFADDAPGRIAPKLLGQPAGRWLLLRPDATATFALDGAFSMIMLRFGVPDGAAASAQLRLNVIADSEPVYQSQIRASVDEPLEILLPIIGVKTLMFRVERLDAGAADTFGLVADPALIK